MSTEMTFETVTAALKQRVEDHNKRLPPHLTKVDPQLVLDAIMIRGATDMETLRELDKAAFIACGLPDALAGAVVKMVGGGTAPTHVPAPIVAPAVAPMGPTGPFNVTVRSVDLATEVEELSPQELLARYNHANPGLVGARLTRLTGGVPFLGFGASGTLDMPASLRRLEALAKNKRVGTTMTLTDGTAVRPKRVGEVLVEAPEHRNPCFPEEALLDGMECERTAESWEGVPREVMQLVTIEATRPGGRPWGRNVESARSVIQAARLTNAMQELSRRYKDAAVTYSEMPAHEREALLTMPTHDSTVNSTGPRGADRGRPFASDSAWAQARPGAIKLAIVAVRKDQDLADDITVCLHPEIKSGRVEVWHPGKSAAGSGVGMVEHVESADVVLVLMSANMFAEHGSDEPVFEAARSVRDAGGIVIPVLARPCKVGVDWLETLQVLPRDGRAVSQCSNHDNAVSGVVNEVAGALRARTRIESLGPMGKSHALLAQADLDALADVCVEVRIDASTLKRGVDARFAASAPGGTSPFLELVAFLEHANSAGELSDGTVPIKTVLHNVLRACGPRTQARTVRAIIDRLEPTQNDQCSINIGSGVTVGAIAFGPNARASGNVR